MGGYTGKPNPVISTGVWLQNEKKKLIVFYQSCSSRTLGKFKGFTTILINKRGKLKWSGMLEVYFKNAENKTKNTC